MRKFIHKALSKLPKMDKGQVSALLKDIAAENERLEAVLESMTDGVIVTDTKHNLILLNKFAERLVPLHGGDVLEQRVWNTIKDNDIAQFLKENLENQERVEDKEFTIDCGTINRVLALSILPLVHEKEIRGSLVHIKDITEKRERDARLRRAESLASLTTLAAGVAHEIKNPLGSISIHLQLIEKAIKKQSEAIQEGDIFQQLDIIHEEVDRLNSIVVDFLFAVRPMDTKMEAHDLNRIIHDIRDFLRYELEEGSIEIHEELDEELPLLELDEKFIKQALLNLVKNAAAAMPEGGGITLQTRLEGDQVVLSVCDTGTGISDEILEKIFEPYFTTKDFGSGLGLTVVYKIVKEHKGEISVRSKEGIGTTFSITLPVPQKEQRLIGWKGEPDEV
jgi:two-component system, sporulation sensor kinase E